MARPTFDDISSIGDAQTSVAFEVRFATIPGVAGAEAGMALRCQQITIPGHGNEGINITLFGHSKKQRGRQSKSHTFTAVFLETAGSPVMQALRQWSENVVGSLSGLSSGEAVYKVDVTIIEYTDAGDVSAEYRIEGVYPEQIDDRQLDGTNLQLVTQSVTFSWDRVAPSNVTLL